MKSKFLLSNQYATKYATILGAVLTLTCVSLRADEEDKINKSFQVRSGGQLLVYVDRGPIEVRTSDRDSVDIEVARKAVGSQAKAEQILKEHVVTITQDDDKVHVHAEYKGDKKAGWFGGGSKLQVRYLITVPRKFDVDLKTAGGQIKVAELSGKVAAHSSGGDLNFEKIEGPVAARTSGGKISVAGCKGNVEVSTSGGSLHLKEIEGDVEGKTSGGAIQVEQLTGKSVVKTSGGSIEATGIRGSMEASTSGGRVHATLLGQPSADCAFKSSGGSVTVLLDETAAVDVDARTSGGRVSCDFSMTDSNQGGASKNVLRGKINGGGPLITASTSAGQVELRKN